MTSRGSAAGPASGSRALIALLISGHVIVCVLPISDVADGVVWAISPMWLVAAALTVWAKGRRGLLYAFVLSLIVPVAWLGQFRARKSVIEARHTQTVLEFRDSLLMGGQDGPAIHPVEDAVTPACDCVYAWREDGMWKGALLCWTMIPSRSLVCAGFGDAPCKWGYPPVVRDEFAACDRTGLGRQGR